MREAARESEEKSGKKDELRYGCKETELGIESLKYKKSGQGK